MMLQRWVGGNCLLWKVGFSNCPNKKALAFWQGPNVHAKSPYPGQCLSASAMAANAT